ncbi:MAG: hypothetical protein JWM93_1470 [Frankiales bacterium]|nr:hypothetical protein [Frankiales bacterium]
MTLRQRRHARRCLPAGCEDTRAKVARRRVEIDSQRLLGSRTAPDSLSSHDLARTALAASPTGPTKDEVALLLLLHRLRDDRLHEFLRRRVALVLGSARRCLVVLVTREEPVSQHLPHLHPVL